MSKQGDCFDTMYIVRKRFDNGDVYYVQSVVYEMVNYDDYFISGVAFTQHPCVDEDRVVMLIADKRLADDVAEMFGGEVVEV